MENDQVEVDDLLKKVERASELLKFCREKLTKTEQDVRDALKDLSPDQNPPVKEE
jgi:exodeoxyribonuclease VII small subunit